VVVGISGDNPKGLALFKRVNKLNFTLLSDFDGSIAKQFGVVTGPGGEIKREVGGVQHVLKRGVTTARWTFVIGKDGKVAKSYQCKDAAGDSKTVLDLAKTWK